MPGPNQPEMPPINYQALDRLVSKLKWKAQDRPSPTTVVQQREALVTPPLTQKDSYIQARRLENKAHEAQTVESGKRMSSIRTHDLESQKALLSPEHKFNEVMRGITTRIGAAEKRLQGRGLLSRTETSDQYQINITVRDTVNAWTYQHGKAVFIETGFISLMDTYLREVKHLSGITEDHLAGLLAHEVSHTDNEAQQSYMNEEYCDAQGVILSAEAGYNPKAMIDVEDFLIYLEKGTDYYHDADVEARTDDKKHALLPSHPPSENRKLVLINILKNTEGVIPNQTHDYTKIQRETIDDLSSQMREWVDKRQKRVLASSRGECITTVDEAANCTELAEAMIGYRLFRRAELAKVIAENEDFETVSVLMDAVTTELKAQAAKKDETFGFNTEGITIGKEVTAYIGKNNEKPYKKGHIPVGGLARGKITVDDEGVREKAGEAVQAMIDDCSKPKPKYWTAYQQAPLFEDGKDLTPQEQELRQQQLNLERDTVSEQRSIQIKNLYTFLLTQRQSINLPAVLSGDFSSYPELGVKLNSLGITDFNTFLNKIQDTFRGLDVNHNLRGLLGEHAFGIFPDPNRLSKQPEKMSVSDVAALLEETRHYRAALVVDARFGDEVKFSQAFQSDSFSQTYNEHLRLRISALARSFSQTPEEQKLLDKLFIQAHNLDYSTFYQSEYVVHQLEASVKTEKEGYDGAETVAPFITTLSPDFFTFRVAPCSGGNILDSYIGNESFSGPTGAGCVMDQWRYLGRRIDDVRVYHGENRYEKIPGRWGEPRFQIRTTPRNTLEAVNLIQKRRKTVPMMQDDIIEESNYEGDTVRIDAEADIRGRWENLKIIAERSSFERRHMENIVIAVGIPKEEKIAYFQQLVSEGKLTYGKVFDGIIIHNRALSSSLDYPLYREISFTYSEASNLRTSYEVAMSLLRTVPISPSWQDINVSDLSQALFDTKVKIAQLEKVGGFTGPAEGVKPHQAGVSTAQTDLYEGLAPGAKATQQLDFIFDFVREGGTIKLSRKNKDGYSNSLSLSGLNNEGANVDIIGILGNLEYPNIEQRVQEVLTLHHDRYTVFEVDKWNSLIAFSKQPYFYIDSRIEDKTELRIRLEGTSMEREFDSLNIDHSLKMIDEIMMLPPSTYRDYCLGFLINKGSDRKYQKEFVDNPGREYYEARIAQLAATAFSDVALSRFDDPRLLRRQLFGGGTDCIPRSERFISDPLGGFYLGESEGVSAWLKLINSKTSFCIRNVFSHKYRENLAQQGTVGLKAELLILSERVKLLSQMPDSQLKEALMLYAIRSSQDRIVRFPEGEKQQLRDQVQILVRDSTTSFKSEQGKQGVVDMRLRDEIGVIDGPISPDALRSRFPTRDEYVSHIIELLPSKSAARDAYLILAVDSYPMRVSDASTIRGLMFATDYSTSDEQVSAQLAGLEFIRSVKANKRVTEQDIREMILWLIDDKRQVKVIDDFFTHVSNDQAGRKLVRGLLEQLKIGPYGRQEEKNEKRGLAAKASELGAEVLTRSLLHLPTPMKRALVGRLVFNISSISSISTMRDKEGSAILLRSGMPAIFGKLSEGNHYSFASMTFNSVLEEGGLESPLKREMFFDLVLGKKGILEEATMVKASDFNDRLNRNFDGSEMHAFIDDVMEIVFRNGKWDRNSQDVARVVSHSFIEAIEPTRRATVLFNLLSELPKIDFNDPDKNRVRSRFLQTALSSIGVLGAKLGQIDELIPKGWGSEMSSLKHSTKPMSKLMIADIFTQEGLSDDYVIKSSAGAASTACGYVVETPRGEEQFAKVLRPEVKMDWQGDFIAVRHMLECLKRSGHLEVGTEPIMQQIERLVREELQTQREIDNVIYYSKAESQGDLKTRGGIRSVVMPKERISTTGQVLPHPEESLVILEELLPKSEYIELAKINAPTSSVSAELVSLKESLDMDSVYSTVVQDFFHRAFTLGSWHSDLHDGNILVRRDGQLGITRVVTGDDLVLIDFGQTGKAETEEKKQNAARFFTGLALRDRSLVAQAIHDALENPVSVENIEKELGINPFKMQERVTAYISQHQTSEYLTNFLKASINVLPYLRRLPVSKQFELITPYISEVERTKGWIRVQEAIATRNFTRLFM